MFKMNRSVEVCLSNNRYLILSVEKLIEKISAAMAEEISGVNASAVKEMLLAMIGHLKEKGQRLEQFERAYITEQSDDPAQFKAREEAMETLMEFLRRVRNFVRENAFDRVRKYGLDERFTEGRGRLFEYATNVANLMSGDQDEILDPLGMSQSPAVMGSKIGVLAQNFHEAMGRVHEEMVELDEARIERDRALEEWRRSYRSIGNILVGFYQIAGEEELAQRIRPTRRKSRGKVLLVDVEVNAGEISEVEEEGEDS